MTCSSAKKETDVKLGTLFFGVDLGLDRNVAIITTKRGQRLATFRFPHEQERYSDFPRRQEKLRKAMLNGNLAF